MILSGYWLKLAQTRHKPANQCFPLILQRMEAFLEFGFSLTRIVYHWSPSFLSKDVILLPNIFLEGPLD